MATAVFAAPPSNSEAWPDSARLLSGQLEASGEVTEQHRVHGAANPLASAPGAVDVEGAVRPDVDCSAVELETRRTVY